MAETLDELIGEVRTVLTKLRYLSEAPAARSLDAVHVNEGGSVGGEPVVDSLYEHHANRLRQWSILAHEDYERRRSRAPGRREPESRQDRDKRLITQWEGTHALEVAIAEDLGQSNVKKIRRRAHRDELYGRRRAAEPVA